MEERFTPGMLVDYIASEQDISIEDMGVKPIVVLSWGIGIVESLAKSLDAQLSKNWIYGERYPLIERRK